MENKDQIGYSFPIICPRHPEDKRFVSKPGELPTLAPEGGCLQPCDFRLTCGHVCPSMVYDSLYAPPLHFTKQWVPGYSVTLTKTITEG
jgi:hypothetical protein